MNNGISDYSKRIALAPQRGRQPVLPSTFILEWLFGNDATHLLAVDAVQSVTRQQLNMNYLVATLRLEPDMAFDLEFIATLRLPEGIKIETDSRKIKALSERFADKQQQLVLGADLQSEPDDEDSRVIHVSTRSQIHAGEALMLHFPLVLSDEAPQFLGVLEASLKAVEGTEIRTKTAATILQPVRGRQERLEVSGCYSTAQSTTEFGDVVVLQLVAGALKDSSIQDVMLQFNTGYSWRPTQFATLEFRGKYSSVTPVVDEKEGMLTLSFSSLTRLSPKETFILTVPVAAEASIERTSVNSITNFTVRDIDGETATTHDIMLPVAQMRGVKVTTRLVRADGTQVKADEALVKGTDYLCHVALNVSGDAITRQTKGKSLSPGEFSTSIRLGIMMSGFDKVNKENITLKDLVLKPNKPPVVIGHNLSATLECFAQRDLSGEMVIPVKVDSSPEASISVSVMPTPLADADPRTWLPGISPVTVRTDFYIEAGLV